MPSTDEDIMVLLQDAIKGADSKDLRTLLEEAIGGPGPHQAVTNSAQADPRVYVVLTTNDGAAFLPKRGFITEHSGLLRDLLADSDGVIKDPVPLPNVRAQELAILLWLLRQGFDAKQLERCIAVFDTEGVVALQQAANFMDVRRITAACGGVIAWLVRKVADDGDRSRLVELVTPPQLPQELCELWLGRYADDLEELLQLLAKHPDELLMPLAHWDSAWADKGRFSEHVFKLSDETEFTLLKARMGVIEQSRGASSLKVRVHADTNDDHLRSVKELSLLTSLNLTYCYHITDTGLAHVKELPQLKDLNLSHCRQITDTGLAHIKELTQLTSLILWGCKRITDKGVARVKELPQLTSLILTNCKLITDMGLAHVKELPLLTLLNLSGCSQITDMGVAHVKELKKLTSLNLIYCHKISDTGLAHLVKLTQLKELDLYGCRQITDVGLAHIKELTLLTSLNLRECKITDAGLVHLKELTELTSLNLTFCVKITDTGLIHLKEVPQLTELGLFGCDQITNEGELFARLLTADVDGSALPRVDLKCKLPDGTTFLHVAAQKNRKDAVAALLERGADVNAVDDMGRTPLQVAIEASALDAVRLLQRTCSNDAGNGV